MRIIFAICLVLSVVGCANGLKRTKETDKARRVMVDPIGLDERQHVGLQNSLVESGQFYVVDRAKGYAAVKKEQDRLHRESPDRFEDKQKFAMFGKLYGVGAVVEAHAQCGRNDTGVLFGILHLATLGMFHNSYLCMQYLDLVDSNTGEIITSIKNEYKTDQPDYSNDWGNAVDKLIASYPTYFDFKPKNQELQTYESMAAENAQRARETAAEKEEGSK